MRLLAALLPIVLTMGLWGGQAHALSPGMRAGAGSVSNEYADASSGNDDFNGRYLGSPKKTIAALRPLPNGGRLHLVRGSTWREEYTPTGVEQIIDAVGTGTDPLLDGSDVVPAGSWTKTAGQTNIYQVALTVESDPKPLQWPGLWIDGTRVTTKGTAATDAGMPAGSIYYSGVTGQTSITLYVHAPGDTDPRSDGKVYETAIRKAGIWAYDATNCTVRGIASRRQYNSYGGVALGQGCTGVDLTNTAGNTHNFFGRAFSTFINARAVSAWADGVTHPTAFVFFEPTPPSGAWARTINSSADLTTASDQTGTIGFFDHTTSGNWALIEHINPTCTNCQTVASNANTDQINVVNPTATTNLNTAFSFTSSATITGGTLNGFVSGGHLLSMLGGATSKTILIDGLTVTMNTSGNISLQNSDLLEVRNSTLTGFNCTISSSATGLTVNFHDNSFVPNGHGNCLSLTGASLTLSSDHNHYHSSTGPWVVGGNTYNTFTLYQAAGYEPTSDNAP
jgi:hypothetical protein